MEKLNNNILYSKHNINVVWFHVHRIYKLFRNRIVDSSSPVPFQMKKASIFGVFYCIFFDNVIISLHGYS